MEQKLVHESRKPFRKRGDGSQILEAFSKHDDEYVQLEQPTPSDRHRHGTRQHVQQ